MEIQKELATNSTTQDKAASPPLDEQPPMKNQRYKISISLPAQDTDKLRTQIIQDAIHKYKEVGNILDELTHSIPWLLFEKGEKIVGYGIDFFRVKNGGKSELVLKLYLDKTGQFVTFSVNNYHKDVFFLRADKVNKARQMIEDLYRQIK